jgi:hypothetical protein
MYPAEIYWVLGCISEIKAIADESIQWSEQVPIFMLIYAIRFNSN